MGKKNNKRFKSINNYEDKITKIRKEVENQEIKELDEATTQMAREIFNTIDEFKKRKLINGHFRPGLCLLHSRNNDFQKVYHFIGVYIGLGSVHHKNDSMIFKNVYTGNMYVTDHCFVRIIKTDEIPEDISPGDIISLNAFVDFYTTKDCSGISKINYGLVYIDNLQKIYPEYSFNFESPDMKLSEVEWLKQMVRLLTVHANLPSTFIETFIISIITGKTRELDLIVKLNDLNIIPKEYEELLIKLFKISIFLISSGCINYLLFQGCVIETLNKTIRNGVDRIDYVNKILPEEPTDDINRTFFNDMIDILYEEIIKNSNIKEKEIRYVIETTEKYFNKFKSK